MSVCQYVTCGKRRKDVGGNYKAIPYAYKADKQNITLAGENNNLLAVKYHYKPPIQARLRLEHESAGMGHII